MKGNNFLIRFMVLISLKMNELTSHTSENVTCTKVQVLQGTPNPAWHMHFYNRLDLYVQFLGETS